MSPPHDHGGSPCLPTHHPQSHRGWPRSVMSTRCDQPNHRTCSPPWPPSLTQGSAPGAATHWSPSWDWQLPRSWRVRGRSPRSPNGPRMPRSRSVPRSAPAERPRTAGQCRPRPRSAGPWPAWMLRPWPGRSAHGWPTERVLTSIDIDGRSRWMARRCGAPAAMAVRSICWRPWSTPVVRCWPSARSTAPPARCLASSRCLATST